MNEQSTEKSDAQKANVRDDASREPQGQQNQPQMGKKENAFTRAESAPTTEKTPAPQKSQELEK